MRSIFLAGHPIIQLLGGQEFLSVTGAYDIETAGPVGVSFKLPDYMTATRYVEINLDHEGTYELIVQRGKARPGIYPGNDGCNLRAMFTFCTGLVTSFAEISDKVRQ
jgi:hypothetical protein